MNFVDHYYIIALGAFSTRLADLCFLVCNIVWNCLIWEIRTYHSTNAVKKPEMERLLDKITRGYWFCTHCRVHVDKLLVPTGFVMGDGFYLAHIQVHQIEGTNNHGNPSRGAPPGFHYTIHVYGWWSMQRLITPDIMTEPDNGNFKLILYCPNYSDTFLKATDYFDVSCFHDNCRRGANLILQDYEQRGQGVYFLTGEPGLGKTSTARMLANILNAYLCLDFDDVFDNAYSIVYSFETLYKYIQPDAACPLVLVIDEVEDYLFRQHKDKDIGLDVGSKEYGESKEYGLRNGKTKKNWSRMLDTIQQKKQVMLILTTNKPKHYFDLIDNALLREYRVSQCLQYESQAVTLIPW